MERAKTRLFKILEDVWTALSAKAVANAETPATFDENFYRLSNPDLSHMNRASLVRHFTKHGRKEGRFSSMSHARSHFAERGRLLPKAFDAGQYRVLNPDLQRLFENNWQFELHYLVHGMGEGRPYRGAEDFRDRPWALIFNLYDFMLYSAAWRSAANSSYEEALELFEEQGIDRLTPLARGWGFDPTFYRQNYAVDEMDATVLYRHWLINGIKQNHAPNERKAIFGLVGDRVYPECFDWKGFSATSSAELYPAKIVALRRLFASEPSQVNQRFIATEGAAELNAAIGDYHFYRGAFGQAARAYALAEIRGSRSARVDVAYGDALRNLGQTGMALKKYERALSSSTDLISAIVQTALLHSEQKHFEKSFTILAAGQRTWAGKPAYRDTVDRCIDLSFNHIKDLARGLIENGDVEKANALCDRELPLLADVIDKFKVGTSRRIDVVDKRIAMLACLDLPQCKRYRVAQRKEQLERLGYALDVFDMNDADAFMRALPGASAAIYYRVSFDPIVVESILYARALGIKTYYDIDDLIFTTAYPDDFESYEGQITRNEYISLQHGVPLYRNAIRLCDYGLAPNQFLAEELDGIVRLGRSFIIANGLDSHSDVAFGIGTGSRDQRSVISLFYGSGTRAHNADFNELLAPALLTTLRRFAHVRLIIVGYLVLDQAFTEFEQRIDRFPFVDGLAKYWSLLSLADVNLAVLRPSRTNDCKSEIKWLEAAVLGIPSIVSPTATHRVAIDAPREGLFASTTEEWTEGIASLVLDADRRKAIGAAARAKVRKTCALENIASELAAALGLPSRDESERDAARYRVLICNVFFAPQTYGGATRVVVDNVGMLVDHYDAEFEISVLTTDAEASAGTFRVDDYRGCRIFRVGTASSPYQDWRPFDDAIVHPYERVLDMVKPDLVHFHCIQRLTASIVECTMRRGIPYVVTLHDGWWLSDYQFFLDHRDMPVDLQARDLTSVLPDGVTRLQSIERQQRLHGLLQQARYALPVSQTFAQIYSAAGLRNIRVVANGVSRLSPAVASTARPDKLVLGHIGTRSTHKGASLIDIALKQGRFRNLALIMIDNHVEYGVDSLTRWGTTQVVMRGIYPATQIERLYASFDVLLAPSIWPESFGLVTREASYYGKWIVASDRGAISEDITDGVDGFKIDVSGTEGLIAVLSKMDQDWERYKRPPPVSARRLRGSEEQAHELAALYAELRTEPLKR